MERNVAISNISYICNDIPACQTAKQVRKLDVLKDIVIFHIDSLNLSIKVEHSDKTITKNE